MSPSAGSGPDRPGLTVAIAGCGLIGWKRAQVLGAGDRLIGATDPVSARADELVAAHGGRACADLDELLGLGADVVVVEATHDQLAPLADIEGWHIDTATPSGRSRRAATSWWRSRRRWGPPRSSR